MILTLILTLILPLSYTYPYPFSIPDPGCDPNQNFNSNPYLVCFADPFSLSFHSQPQKSGGVHTGKVLACGAVGPRFKTRQGQGIL